MDFAQARFNMVEQQIRPWDVLNTRILAAIEQTPREHFVSPAHQKLAYADLEIPLDCGEYMMSPKLEARLLQALDPQPSEICLEVGTGSGYLTACLARLCAQVDSIEIHAPLKQAATQRLKAQGIENCQVREGDAAYGYTRMRMRYDLIAVTGSLPEYHPAFEQQLTLGGRLFVITGEGYAMQAHLITRLGEGEFAREVLLETHVPALQGVKVPDRFVF